MVRLSRHHILNSTPPDIAPLALHHTAALFIGYRLAAQALQAPYGMPNVGYILNLNPGPSDPEADDIPMCYRASPFNFSLCCYKYILRGPQKILRFLRHCQFFFTKMAPKIC